jgi:hypothetical protein
MNEHFLKSKPVAPPKRFVETDIAAAASNFVAEATETSEAGDLEHPSISDPDLEPSNAAQPRAFGREPTSSSEVDELKSALTRGFEVCNEYVHQEPWHAALVAGAMGFLIGLTLSTRSPSSRYNRL